MKLYNLLTIYLADGLDPPRGLGGPANFGALVGAVTNALLMIAGAVAVIMIIVGGIQFALSAGDEGKAKTARSIIANAVIGLVVTLMAYAIVNFIIVTIQ